MAKRDVEAAVEAVGALRGVSPQKAAEGLRRGLSDRVSLVVTKAAKIAAEMQLRELIPELLAAYDRLFIKPAERDPQCWAKTAIARTLVDFEYRDHAPFLMGARHIQMEPVWGGAEDTAQTLRGICLLALVTCLDFPRAETLRVFVDSLADPAESVRIEALRAIEQMEGEEACLLVRLKARAGDKDSAVTGQAFDSLLRLEPTRGLEFVKEYLDSPRPELQEEAALALGASRKPEAAGILIEAFAHAVEPNYRKTLLRALAATREEKALAFLRSLVENGGMDGAAAKEALAL